MLAFYADSHVPYSLSRSNGGTGTHEGIHYDPLTQGQRSIYQLTEK